MAERVGRRDLLLKAVSGVYAAVALEQAGEVFMTWTRRPRAIYRAGGSFADRMEAYNVESAEINKIALEKISVNKRRAVLCLYGAMIFGLAAEVFPETE